MGLSIELAEKSWLPDSAIRMGIRRLLRKRLADCSDSPGLSTVAPHTPVAVDTDAANEQHYEVPPEFFSRVLGPHRKYSCCYYENPASSLVEAEEAMLRMTCERAGLRDGIDILELGCGWGSLTLWMATHYPNSLITAVSNSNAQRETIEELAATRGLSNITIITADINKFRPEQKYDRIVSVEMFEHVRNHEVLLERINEWLGPDGKLFIHIFCHKKFAYLYEDRGSEDWMTRHFFRGGMMPSFDYLGSLEAPFRIDTSWKVGGTHYARTCRHWLARLDGSRSEVMQALGTELSPGESRVQLQRWRMFFMACEELFAYNGGSEWFVGHYLLSPAHRSGETVNTSEVELSPC